MSADTPADRSYRTALARQAMVTQYRVGVIGAGIVGLAVARRLLEMREDVSVDVLEKEAAVATHQTGHNSGVVHSGIYYTPGSEKARMCTRGVRLLHRYCQEKGLAYDEVGKLIAAVSRDEIPRLKTLLERGRENGVPALKWLDGPAMREVEPHVGGMAAIHLPHSAIVDYRQVALQLAADITAEGGRVRLGREVLDVQETDRGVRVVTSEEEYEFDIVIACAGLHADRIARLAGDEVDPMIIPFRGEYASFRQDRTYLVRGLIYPVPDPRYPFLGVHLTRQVGGAVTLGPNAVLALAREGYRSRDIVWQDLKETLLWSGFRRLAFQHWRTALKELSGSVSRRRFVAMARPYLPELQVADVIPSPAGVRAQAVDAGGRLVNDFVITQRGRMVNVRNAPSPAATASLAIAEYVVDRVLEGLG